MGSATLIKLNINSAAGAVLLGVCIAFMKNVNFEPAFDLACHGVLLKCGANVFAD